MNLCNYLFKQIRICISNNQIAAHCLPKVVYFISTKKAITHCIVKNEQVNEILITCCHTLLQLWWKACDSSFNPFYAFFARYNQEGRSFLGKHNSMTTWIKLIPECKQNWECSQLCPKDWWENLRLKSLAFKLGPVLRESSGLVQWRKSFTVCSMTSFLESLTTLKKWLIGPKTLPTISRPKSSSWAMIGNLKHLKNYNLERVI